MLARLERRRRELLAAVASLERRRARPRCCTRPRPPALGFLFLTADVDVVLQLARSPGTARRRRLRPCRTPPRPSAAKYCAFSGTLIRSSGWQPSGSSTLRSSQIRGMLCLPGFAHAADEAVRAAQQQHVRAQRVAARQHAEVLQHDGVEQRGHQLVRRHALFLQAVDIGLGEHAALAGDVMQLDPVVAQVAQLVRRESSAWR